MMIQDEYPVLVFHPDESIRVGWDLFIMLIMIYLLFDIPIQLCFQLELPLYSSWSRFDLAVDVFFMADILFNFNTGYLDRECRYITSRRSISISYITGWFWIDLITSIPFEYVSESHTVSQISYISKLTRFLKFVRLVRLLKVMRVMKAFSKFEERSEGGSLCVRFFKCATCFALIAHYAACVFVGIQFIYRDDDRSYENMYGYHESSWIVRFQDTWEQTKTTIYLRAVYWAFTTLSTVGYGDITPLLPLEIVCAILTQLCGCSLFGLMYYMTREDATRTMIKEKIAAVREFMNYRKIPNHLSNKIRRHYGFAWKQTQVYKEEEILADLPQALRIECSLFLYKDIIKAVDFLSTLRKESEDVLPGIVLRLKPAHAAHEDVLILEGRFGQEMYFVYNGNLAVTVRATKYFGETDSNEQEELRIKDIKTGDCFADYAVVMDRIRHPASLISESFSDLFVLTRTDFLNFGEEYPLVYEEICKNSKKRYLEFISALMKTRQHHTFMKDFNMQDDRFTQVLYDSHVHESTIMRHTGVKQYHSDASKILTKLELEMKSAQTVSLGMRLKYRYLKNNLEKHQKVTLVAKDSKYKHFKPRTIIQTEEISGGPLQKLLKDRFDNFGKALSTSLKSQSKTSTKKDSGIYLTQLNIFPPHILDKLMRWKDRARLKIIEKQMQIVEGRFNLSQQSVKSCISEGHIRKLLEEQKKSIVQEVFHLLRENSTCWSPCNCKTSNIPGQKSASGGTSQPYKRSAPFSAPQSELVELKEEISKLKEIIMQRNGSPRNTILGCFATTDSPELQWIKKGTL